LGIIPARSGSKSIPRKNIVVLAGKPLIAHTIQAALDAKHTDRVIVSTDSQEIADVARLFGAEVPFLRPPELAQDDTPGIEPILHAVRWLSDNDDYHPDYVMVLQPTSPLRTAEDIKAAVQLAQKQHADSVVSVCPVRQHPYWMKRITDDGRLVDFLSLDRTYAARQDLPPVYALNGAIYLIRREILLERQTFYTEHTYAYVMPLERSVDIDTEIDFKLAELLMRERECK
jgi:CMP-N,N'-diacetyllegionaminic acid synthase